MQRNFTWADPFLKHDKEVLQAVSKNEQALRFASPELKADKEFIMEIISEHGNALCTGIEDPNMDMSRMQKNED